MSPYDSYGYILFMLECLAFLCCYSFDLRCLYSIDVYYIVTNTYLLASLSNGYYIWCLDTNATREPEGEAVTEVPRDGGHHKCCGDDVV